MPGDATEVLVVGGGPAGCTAARLLALWGHEVRLVAKPHAAASVGLAESLTPSCGKFFDLLGIRDAIDTAGFVPTTGNTVWWGTTTPRVETFADGAWGEPEALGGVVASEPAVTAWAVGEMEVFAVFDDGGLWNRYWDGVAWHPWESLGGELAGSPSVPSVSSWGPDRLDVFAAPSAPASSSCSTNPVRWATSATSS